MSSFIGKMLYVDLSSSETESRSIPREWAEKYSGQKGLGSRILMEGFDPKTDPRSPDNRLVLATSIMGGTIVSCSAKLAMITKSPQTGTISDGSVGGHLGAELKYAGYDAVLITGKAPELSYLYIDPDKVEIRSAADLAGAGTFKTDEVLKQKIGDDQVKIIANGPAGENQVPFSCVSAEKYRQLGRGGMGAVMGSKNLKAVVVRGWLDVSVPDIDQCMQLAAEMHKKDEVTSPENEIYTDGTPMIVEYTQEAGVLPTRNFQEGQFEGYKNISATAMKEIRRNKKACFSCGIACGNFVKTDQSEVEGPEYETIALCGSSIGNADREKLVEFNAVCDDLGLDTISVGGVIAFLMEATEKGVKDFGIRFGEIDNALKLLGQIANLEGVGAEAALGTKRLSEKYGGQDFAMQVKGLELPGYDPRGSWAMGIGYATAPRGGCHMSAFPIEAEAFGDLDPFTFEGKAKLVVELQNAQFAKFSMGVCDFWPIKSENLARLFEVTFGGTWTAEQVVKIGERIFNLQRMFNVMAGFSREEDRLPARLHKELLKTGPPKDIPMPEEAFQQAMDEYYAFRGWDEQGRPTVAKLKDLGIEPEFIAAYEKSLN
jgi:aldehyde:ferredoxin oxidoreductase